MEYILRLIDFISIELTVLLTAALPVVELRGAIPVGISLGLSPLHAAVLGFIGSMIPVPIILFAARPVFNYLRQTRLFRKLVGRLTDNSRRNRDKIQKYGVWGLIVLVAIPLPGTGVWREPGGGLAGYAVQAGLPGYTGGEPDCRYYYHGSKRRGL